MFSLEASKQHAIAPTIPASGRGYAHAGESRGQDAVVAATLTQGAESRGKGGYGVRRLTPRECERLMGLPDDYTRIPWRGKPAEKCPDGPRYRAIGNSWVIPEVRWLGERIGMVDKLLAD